MGEEGDGSDASEEACEVDVGERRPSRGKGYVGEPKDAGGGGQLLGRLEEG